MKLAPKKTSIFANPHICSSEKEQGGLMFKFNKNHLSLWGSIVFTFVITHQVPLRASQQTQIDQSQENISQKTDRKINTNNPTNGSIALRLVKKQVELEQQKQRVFKLLNQSINKFYDKTSGYSMFTLAALMGLLTFLGIHNYVPKKRIPIGTGHDDLRGITVNYFTDITDMPEKEKQKLTQENQHTWLLYGGSLATLFAALGYYYMNYENQIIQVAQKYNKNPRFIYIENNQKEAINKWFDEIAKNLEINQLTESLDDVDDELYETFNLALQTNKSENFKLKCKCAFLACALLNLIKVHPQAKNYS